MICDLNLIIGKEPVTLKINIQNSENLMQLVAEVLSNNSIQREQLSKKLESVVNGKPVKFGTKGLDGSFVPNKTIRDLRKQYPTEKFGNVDCLILLTAKCTKAGKSYVGDIYKLNGQKVFILSPNMLGRFALYSRIVEQLNKMSVITDEFLLDELPKIAKYKNTKDFLIDFMEDNDKYIKSLSSENYSKINQYLRSLLGKSDRFNGELTDLALAIKDKLFETNDEKTAINKLSLINILKNSDTVDSTVKEKLKNNNYTDLDLKTYLYKYLLKEIEWHTIGSTDKIIKIAPNYKNLSDKLGIGFNTIIDARPVTVGYKGYNIYSFEVNGKDVFVGVEGFLSLYSPAYKTFNSINELQQYIDSKELERKLELINVDSTSLGILFTKTLKHYSPGQVVKVVNYSREGLTISDSNLRKYTMQTFRNEILSRYSPSIANEIISQLEDPLSAYYFLKYSGRDQQREVLSPEELEIQDLSALDLMNDILENSDSEYYTVLNSTKNAYSGYDIKLVRIEDSDLDRITSSGQTYARGSIDVLFEAIKTAFGNQGVHIEIVNNPDSDAKAYIKNGIIYLNKAKATYKDALHEYTHLFLGILKHYNPDIYDSILENYKLYISEDSFNYYKDRYKLTDENEIYEEILADNYAKYLNVGTRSRKMVSALANVSRGLEESTGVSALIWENSGNEDLQDFLKKFFNFVQETTTDVGLLIPTTQVDREAAKNYINSEIPSVNNPDETDIISKICK